MWIRIALAVALVLLLASPVSGALTTKYANFDLATGSNDGTSEADAWQTWAAVVAGIAAGDRVCVKQTASRHGTGATFTTDSTISAEIVLEGYKTTCGDGGDNGIANYFQSGSVTIATAKNYHLKYFDFTGDPGAATYLLKSNTVLDQFSCNECYFEDTNTGKSVPVVMLDDEGTLLNCYIVVPANGWAASTNDAGLVEGSIVDMTASGAEGIFFTNSWQQYGHIVGNIIFGSGSGRAIWGENFVDADLAKSRFIAHNTIYNVGTGIEFDNVRSAGGAASELVVNNLIYGATTGIHNVDGTQCSGIAILYNATGNISGNAYEGWSDCPTNFGAVTITTDPFINAASGDFRLNSKPGGGLVVQHAALSADNRTGSGTLARHIGAVQSRSLKRLLIVQ